MRLGRMDGHAHGHIDRKTLFHIFEQLKRIRTLGTLRGCQIVLGCQINVDKLLTGVVEHNHKNWL